MSYQTTKWIKNNEVITIQEVEKWLEYSVDIDLSDILHLGIHVGDNDRVESANLNYPIIVSKLNGEYKMILDGHHRLKKAMDSGLAHIAVKILNLDRCESKFREFFV